MKRDDLIFDIIEKEHQRQLKGIELIASENFVSDQVMQAMGSCLTNKYAEGYPGKRYYGGCEVVDQSEQIAIDRLKQIFGAEWANVQPHSGAQANAAVFLAVLNPGDKFMGLNLAHGGHLSHGSSVNTSGIIYTPCEYNLNKETGRVDYDQMEEVALREKPKMIIGGGSAYSREWDYKRMRVPIPKGCLISKTFLPFFNPHSGIFLICLSTYHPAESHFTISPFHTIFFFSGLSAPRKILSRHTSLSIVKRSHIQCSAIFFLSAHGCIIAMPLTGIPRRSLHKLSSRKISSAD